MGEASNGKVPQSVKYAIIGAGIHGLSTAFHLAQMLKKTGRGSGEDILVVDKTAIAAGASGIACGVVRNNYFQP
ncbi:FAD-dependent oxidoreductase, partial [Methyloceanibacter sp.]|uniref:FAD-dependent oxidoreductase n=1 Tax=Methyloceanibacter sp. TaxID=1965321 RepID=UPI003C76AE3F